MKNTIEDPLILSVYSNQDCAIPIFIEPGEHHLVDLSVAIELQKQLSVERDTHHWSENNLGNAINVWRNENDKLKIELDEQKKLINELVTYLTKIRDMANPEIDTDSSFYHCSLEALVKYEESIKKIR